jgi:hypothetical protein
MDTGVLDFFNKKLRDQFRNEHCNTELRAGRHVTGQHDKHEPQQTHCTKTFILI